MSSYYNEWDSFAAQWLRNLISKGLIPDGEVDERSILNVQSDDLRGFKQCHFFAGIGGWSRALSLANWPDDKEVWTGSCPCQPLSVAGKQKGADDERHVWPAFFSLIAKRRPPIVFGEQVSGALGCEWFAGVRADMEDAGYACGGADLCAAGVGSPHIRQRLYWCAVDYSKGARLERWVVNSTESSVKTGNSDSSSASGNDINLADANLQRRSRVGILLRNEEDGRDAQKVFEATRSSGSFWNDSIWITGSDGKTRRAKPGISLLAHGIPNRMGRLRGYGNAIVPQVAAEMISAFMECVP